MKPTITEFSPYTLAVIKLPDCKIAKAFISCDVHQNNSHSDQAIHELYGEILLSGTAKYSRDVFLDKVNSLGAEIEVSITDGVITVALSSPAETWSRLMTLVQTMISEPAFTANELKRVKQLTKNALHDQKENTKYLATAALRNELFNADDRKSSASINDLQNACEQVTRKDLQTFHTTFRTSKWTCSVVGNSVVTDKFEKLIKTTHTGKNNAGNEIRYAHKSTIPSRLLVTNVPSKQNIDVNIGTKTPITITNNDFVPLQFGIAVLAKWGGFAGRLMSTVREQEGLTYSIYGQIEGATQDEIGYLRIMTFFNPKQVIQGLTSTFREIEQLHKKGITEQEYQSFKTILGTQQILKNDSPLRQLASVHSYNKLGFSVTDIELFESKLKTITKKEINEAIAKYLDPAQMVVSVAGPTKSVENELTAFIEKVR